MTLAEKIKNKTDQEKREYLGLQIDKSDQIETEVETRLQLIQDRKAILLVELAKLP